MEAPHSENSFTYISGSNRLITEDFNPVRIRLILEEIIKNRRIEATHKEIKNDKKLLDLRMKYVKMIKQNDKATRKEKTENYNKKLNEQRKSINIMESIRLASVRMIKNSDK